MACSDKRLIQLISKLIYKTNISKKCAQKTKKFLLFCECYYSRSTLLFPGPGCPHDVVDVALRFPAQP
jgi:hypothetical protein